MTAICLSSNVSLLKSEPLFLAKGKVFNQSGLIGTLNNVVTMNSGAEESILVQRQEDGRAHVVSRKYITSTSIFMYFGVLTGAISKTHTLFLDSNPFSSFRITIDSDNIRIASNAKNSLPSGLWWNPNFGPGTKEFVTPLPKTDYVFLAIRIGDNLLDLSINGETVTTQPHTAWNIWNKSSFSVDIDLIKTISRQGTTEPVFNMYVDNHARLLKSYFVDILYKNLIDSDSDGLTDDREILIGSDPFNDDSDFDKLMDGDEFLLKTDIFSVDTDNDSFSDYTEYLSQTDALNPVSHPEILEIKNAIEIIFQTVRGHKYQIQTSANLISWNNYNEVIRGLGDNYSMLLPIEDEFQYYRLNRID